MKKNISLKKDGGIIMLNDGNQFGKGQSVSGGTLSNETTETSGGCFDGRDWLSTVPAMCSMLTSDAKEAISKYLSKIL